MKVYISEENFTGKERMSGFDLVRNYYETDTIVVVPGGLSSIKDILQGIIDGKDVYLYNKDLFYASIIEQIYQLYEKGNIDKLPSELLNIESDINKIIEKLEEKKNVNDGKTSKLL